MGQTKNFPVNNRRRSGWNFVPGDDGSVIQVG